MPASLPYLSPSEYPSYGCKAADDEVFRASRLIDTWCGRTKYGFIYGSDLNAQPAFMQGASPDLTFIAPGSISPGANVVVPVVGPVQVDLIGKTLTLEAGIAGKCEVCQISAITQNQAPTPCSITLAAVQTSHTGPVTMVGGLQVYEERFIDAKRAYSRLALTPVIRLLSGAGIIEYGRRSDQVTGSYYDNSILAVFATANWGGAPPWLIFDVTQCGIESQQGLLWVPVSVYLLRYSKIRIFYISGFPDASSLPAAIKQACANIANSFAALGPTPFQNSNIKRAAAGDTSLERFKNIAIDAETEALLEAYRANQYY